MESKFRKRFQSPVSRGKSFHSNQEECVRLAKALRFQSPVSRGKSFHQAPISLLQDQAGMDPFQSPVSRGKSFHAPMRHHPLPRRLGHGFNPLSVGASHSTQAKVALNALIDALFQSPVSRGKSFHRGCRAIGSPRLCAVSIPCQSGQVIPLFTSFAEQFEKRGFVSIPCQSGQVIPQAGVEATPETEEYAFQSPVSRGKSFHPLHALPSADAAMTFQSPVSRGKSFHTIFAGRWRRLTRLMFQSPVSRGKSFHSTRQTTCAGKSGPTFQSPVSRGKSFHMTNTMTAQEFLKAVSIPCQSGQVIPPRPRRGLP